MSSPVSTAPARPTPGGWTDRAGRAGRFGSAFAAVWLVFLVDSLKQAWALAWGEKDRLAGVLGLVDLLVFAALYLAIFVWVRRRRLHGLTTVPDVYAAAALGALCVLGALLCWAIGEEGLSTIVYIVVVAVMMLPTVLAAAWTVGTAALTAALGATVPGWTVPSGLVFAVCTAGFAMWGVQQLMLRNLDLITAHEENARLVVNEERNRFARDLHDILGHSLTVITVKAELAGKLLDVDPARARIELADLERLSRDALADVRRAVEGYRGLTLPGELARARAALESAGIRAELPNSTDDVPSHLRELYAWTVREAVTNVIRHSRATCCRVRMSDHEVEVCDDGSGPGEGVSGQGHGLVGLRERAAAVGATVVTQSADPGFCLRVVAS